MNVRVSDGMDIFQVDDHDTPKQAACELANICQNADISLDDLFKNSSLVGASLWDTLKICSEAEKIANGGSVICHRGGKRYFYNNQGGVNHWNK